MRKFEFSRLPIWFPLAVVGAGFSISILAHGVITFSIQRSELEAFQRLSDRALFGFSQRLLNIEKALHGMRGLFSASKSVEREEWRRYVESLDLDDYTGAMGFGYIRRVPRANLDSILSEIRSDQAPGFKLANPGTDSEHFLITFIEPMEWNQSALGLDISFEDRRRQAAIEAMEKDSTRLTLPVSLVQDTTAHARFLMLVPVFANGSPHATLADRRRHHLGWTYAPIRIKGLLAGLGEDLGYQVGFAVYQDLEAGETGIEAPLYEENGPKIADNRRLSRIPVKWKPTYRTSRAFHSHGRKWELAIWARPEFVRESWKNAFSWLILVGGAALSALAGWLSHLAMTVSQKAESAARDMTRDLNRTLSQLREAKRSAEDASKRALEANLAKSHFLASMSHEIRTPLNGLIGAAQLLTHSTLDSGQKELVRTLIGSSDVLLALINDILDLSKIEAGRIELAAIPCHGRQLAENALQLVSELAYRKGLRLVLDYPRSVAVNLIGDSTRVVQILVNLLGNAIKFTEHGEVLVRAVQEPGRLRISILDSGIGIPEAKRHLLFNRFTQLEAGATRRFGGTGLGLAISKQFAEAMGGSLEYAPGPQAGSEFMLRLPLNDSPLLQPKDRFESPDLDLAGRKIMLGIESPADRGWAAELIREWGGCPIVLAEVPENASNGLSALPAGELAGIILSTGYLTALRPWLSSTPETRSEFGSHRPRRILVGPGEYPATNPASNRKSDNWNLVLREPGIQPTRLLRCLAGFEEESGGRDPRSAGKADFAGCRVLLVDDNGVNRKITGAMLRRLGVPFDLACNGREALEKLKSEPFQVVLMDWEMPEMDGLEATRIFRKWEENMRSGQDGTLRRARIFALTANALIGDREKCLAAGMDGYLSKPLKETDLFSALAGG